MGRVASLHGVVTCVAARWSGGRGEGAGAREDVTGGHGTAAP